MNKFAALVTIGLAFSPAMVSQESFDAFNARRQVCLDTCLREHPNPELQRQEVIALEKEAARAIQLGNPAFFNRVYSEDFSGNLSHGEPVDKARLIAAVQAPDIKYESFTASNIKVRVYRDTAVATSLWSMRAVFKGHTINSQMLVMHVYAYGPSGYRVVSGQTTLLPPYPQQPL
jgi:hypothetical protein